MAKGDRNYWWCKVWAITSLSKFINEHETAISYDLLTQTNYNLEDIGGALSWSAFSSFVRNLSVDSATFRSMNPDLSVWGTRIKTNFILADIYDLLAIINSNMIALGTHSLPKKPKAYPRPNKNTKDENTQKIGKDGMPPDQLRKWFDERRRNGRRYD